METEIGCNFDAGKFIDAIKKRPPLWDTTLPSYGNREIKKDLWDEMVALFEGDGLSEVEQIKLGNNLQKKWKNIRDCYGRELRRQKVLNDSIKSGSATKRKNSYVYFKQLSFLNKCTVTPRVLQKTSQTYSKKRKKEETAEATSTSKEIQDKTYQIDDDDDDRLFLMSLLPDIKKVPESVKLSTKMELMSVIQRAQNLEDERGTVDDDDVITPLFKIESDIDIQENRVQNDIDYDHLTEELTNYNQLVQENTILKGVLKKMTALQEQQSRELLLSKQNEARLSQMVQAVRQIVTDDNFKSILHTKEEMDHTVL